MLGDDCCLFPDNNTQLDIKNFPKVVVVYMLKALEHGSIEARQQFPRLLQILELYPETVNEFIKKVRERLCMHTHMHRLT